VALHELREDKTPTADTYSATDSCMVDGGLKAESCSSAVGPLATGTWASTSSEPSSRNTRTCFSSTPASRETASATALLGSGAQCSSGDGKNSKGDNLKQAPQSPDAQTCCNHCSETPKCGAWTFIKGDGECWLKEADQILPRDQWQKDTSAVSGVLQGPSPSPSPGGQCTQLSGTYCAGQGQWECGCNWCDDFCRTDACATSCRVMNGHFASPAGYQCQWTAASISSPNNAADNTPCTWMEGNGQGGKGDNCQQCDENAKKCRRANPQGNCKAGP